MSNVTAEDVRKFLLNKYSKELAIRGLSPEAVSESFDLVAEGIIDSFGVLEMITHVEKEFSVELSADGLDAKQLTILGLLCEYVAKNANRSQ
jgi:acyl carrier protein